jgi:hypothetical protein
MDSVARRKIRRPAHLAGQEVEFAPLGSREADDNIAPTPLHNLVEIKSRYGRKCNTSSSCSSAKGVVRSRVGPSRLKDAFGPDAFSPSEPSAADSDRMATPRTQPTKRRGRPAKNPETVARQQLEEQQQILLHKEEYSFRAFVEMDEPNLKRKRVELRDPGWNSKTNLKVLGTQFNRAGRALHNLGPLLLDREVEDMRKKGNFIYFNTSNSEARPAQALTAQNLGALKPELKDGGTLVVQEPEPGFDTQAQPPIEKDMETSDEDEDLMDCQNPSSKLTASKKPNLDAPRKNSAQVNKPLVGPPTSAPIPALNPSNTKAMDPDTRFSQLHPLIRKSIISEIHEAHILPNSPIPRPPKDEPYRHVQLILRISKSSVVRGILEGQDAKNELLPSKADTLAGLVFLATVQAPLTLLNLYTEVWDIDLDRWTSTQPRVDEAEHGDVRNSIENAIGVQAAASRPWAKGPAHATRNYATRR